MKRFGRWILTGVVLALASTATAAQEQPSPSLGDVAKQQKGTKKAKHVYTDDDLPRGGAGVSVVGTETPAAAPASAGTAPAGPGAAKAPAAAAPKPDSEEAKQAKARAEELAKDVENYEDRRKRYQARIDAETDPKRKAEMEQDLVTMDRNLEHVRKQAADAAATAAGNAPKPPAAPAQEPPKQ